MRVLNVIGPLHRGGIQVMLHQAIPELQRLGIDSDVCSLHSGGSLADEFASLGCNVYEYPRRNVGARGYQEVTRTIASGEYDIVHSHFGFTSSEIVRAARERNVPAIVSVHNNEGPAQQWAKTIGLRECRRALFRWHYKRTIRTVSLYLGHSAACLDAIEPAWRDRSDRFSVIDNGVRFPESMPDREASRRMLGIPEGRPCLLHVGDFRYQKNHVGLLKILEKVLEQEPGALLVLVGARVKASIAALIGGTPLESRVVCAGEQGNVWPYYRAADVFVFPSHYEGFGNVLVEAQAAEIPIVASRIGPHLRSVAPSQQDFLFDLPDYAAAARLVGQQLRDNESARLGRVTQARQHVTREFSIGRYAQTLASIYASVAPSQRVVHNSAA